MYLSKTPALLKPLARDLTWQVDTSEKILYLTFDDGPTPDVTDRVLALLRSFDAKASFFCVGNNIGQHPSLYASILKEGHSIGNHTFDHENGWKTSNGNYFRSYLKCQHLTQSNLFRPPYGKISKSQSKAIVKRSKIIMWDVLSGDFDSKSTPKQCLDRVIKHARPGSIIVFHDSAKAQKNMLYALRGTLAHFSELGYRFENLDCLDR